jgi:hypothetical protein
MAAARQARSSKTMSPCAGSGFSSAPHPQNSTKQTTENAMKTTARIPDLQFENPDGSPLKITTDCFGRDRIRSSPFPGPFEIKETGRQKIKIWPRN